MCSVNWNCTRQYSLFAFELDERLAQLRTRPTQYSTIYRTIKSRKATETDDSNPKPSSQDTNDNEIRTGTEKHGAQPPRVVGLDLTLGVHGSGVQVQEKKKK